MKQRLPLELGLPKVISEMIMDGQFEPGDIIEVLMEDEQLVFRKAIGDAVTAAEVA